MFDGSNIPCDVKFRAKSQHTKHEFLCNKPNSKGRHGWNFVVVLLPNGLVGSVLHPVPGRSSDSIAVKVDQNLRLLNSIFTSDDVLLGDGGFKVLVLHKQRQ